MSDSIVAADCLGCIGDAGAVPALLQAQDDRRINEEPLIEALQSSDAKVQFEALQQLKLKGSDGAKVKPYLVRILQGKNSWLFREVIYTLPYICGPEDDELIPFLIAALLDKDILLRGEAAEALGRIGPAAAPAVPILLRNLKGGDYRDYSFEGWQDLKMTFALMAIGTQDPLVLFALSITAAYENLYQKSAISLLKRNPLMSIPFLIQDLKDEVLRRNLGGSHYHREWSPIAQSIARVLGQMGSLAVLSLLDLLASKNDPLSVYAAYTLSEMEPKEAVSAFVPLIMMPRNLPNISSDPWFEREHSLDHYRRRAIDQIAPHAISEIPKLMTLAESRVYDDLSISSRRQALDGLRMIGPQAQSQVPRLMALLQDPNSTIRREVIFVLEAIASPHAIPAIPALEKIAQVDPEMLCREAAEYTLEKLMGGLR